MTDWPGESRWTLWSLTWCHWLNPLQKSERMKGRRRDKEGFLSLETITTHNACVPFRGWTGKTKDLSAFDRGMVVGARRTGLSVSRSSTLLDCSHNSFPVCIKNGPPPKGHAANLTQQWESLTSTWASISVERLTHCSVRAPTNWGRFEGKRGATQS
jgi:hypothetical protein